MTDFSQYLSKHLRKLPQARHSRASNHETNRAKTIALNLNENPFGPSPLAIAAIERAIGQANRYPDAQSANLQHQVATFHGVKEDQVLVTAGASEFINLIATALLGRGLNAITSAKSFIVYKLATQLTEGRLIEVPTRNDGYDLAAISKTINRETRVVFIANPNNPTGSVLNADDIDGFLGRIPDHVLVVLDEAYCDFAEDFAAQRGVKYSRSLDYVRGDRNVIVLKTFSKAHGLAGLRIGYGIGPARLISLFAPLQAVFSVSSIAQIAATAALHDSEHINRAVKNNAEQADILACRLKGFGFRVPQTWANFLYCELKSEAAGFCRRLQERGVAVQPLELWGAPDAFRVSIGTPQENQTFLAAVERALQ